MQGSKIQVTQSAFCDLTVTDGNHFTTHYKGKLSPGTPVLVVVFSSRLLAPVCTAHHTAHYQSSTVNHQASNKCSHQQIQGYSCRGLSLTVVFFLRSLQNYGFTVHR